MTKPATTPLTTLGDDLNGAIVAAVNARVEAAVLAALSGDDVMGRLVTVALMQRVEVPKRDGSYGKEHVPWVSALLDETIRKAAREAVTKVVEDQRPAFEAAIAKALVDQRKNVAAQLVTALMPNRNGYMSVNLSYAIPSE